ncbi:MAG: thioredoxin domain-containing protein [Gemmatimonadaceae bacterium]|nr:thioredoxin domain-containing protein [Gemmatimonadaceae bacterium]
MTTFYEDWRELTERGHRMGKESAPVQIVVFSDYQCPYCRSVTPTIEQLLAKYPETVAVTYRHFLLEDIHPQARDAAISVECAAEQGRFATMHRVLFDSVKTLGKTPWENLAAIAGVVDRAAFTQCMKAPRHNDAIAADLTAVVDVGIGAVPALVINGTLVMGAKSFEVVDGLVKQALEGAGDRR